MHLSTDLNEFNSQFATNWLHVFPQGVKAFQGIDDDLLFRGPVKGADGTMHDGCHVAVKLPDDVKAALAGADQPTRDEMIENLSCSLGSQMEATYSPDMVGQFALEIVGDIRIINRA